MQITKNFKMSVCVVLLVYTIELNILTNLTNIRPLNTVETFIFSYFTNKNNVTT